MWSCADFRRRVRQSAKQLREWASRDAEPCFDLFVITLRAFDDYDPLYVENSRSVRLLRRVRQLILAGMGWASVCVSPLRPSN